MLPGTIKRNAESLFERWKPQVTPGFGIPSASVHPGGYARLASLEPCTSKVSQSQTPVFGQRKCQNRSKLHCALSTNGITSCQIPLLLL